MSRLRVTATDPAPASTTRLGDWYANTLIVGRKPIILFMSASTLLPVLVAQREIGSLVPRFRTALRAVLEALAVPVGITSEECDDAGEVVFGRTESRRVLGAMNDFAFQARWECETRPDHGLLAVSLRLAEMPSRPIGYRHPAMAVADTLRITRPLPNNSMEPK